MKKRPADDDIKKLMQWVDGAAGSTWEEFCAQADAEAKIDWVLESFIPPRGLVVVAGEQKSGKTVWLGWLVGEILRQGKRVLFVELEGSRGMLRSRLDLFAPEDRSGLRIRFRMKDRLDADGIVRLREAVEAFEPHLVVIDPLFRAMDGDENDTTTMRQVVTHLELLSELCAVAVLHHVRKAPKEGRDLLTSADVRGSSGLLSAASVIALVHKKERPQKFQARFDVECADSWFEPFELQRCLVDFHPGAEHMQWVEEESADTPRSREVRDAVVKALKGSATGQLSSRGVLKASGKQAWEVRQALLDLADEGLVQHQKGPRNSNLYFLRETQP